MSDRTYTESIGLAPFDWRKAINDPESYAHEDLCEWAMKWTTCACGNQCAIIPRKESDLEYEKGAPLDFDLKTLGHAFYSAVCNQTWNRAASSLDQIEARSAILIAEELAKLNTVTEDANA